MNNDFLFSVFVFLAAACIVVPLASRVRMGSVLGYLAAGVLVGPYGFRLIGNAEQVMHFAEFGVVMMLFVIGLELEPVMLWRMRKSIVGLGGLQVAVTSVAFAAVGTALGFSWQVSLVVGMALSLSSTALVLQMLNEKNLMNTHVGETSFSVLLFQDIAVIPILVIIPLLAVEGQVPVASSHDMFSGMSGWAHALLVALVIGMVVALGRYFSRYLFHFIAKTNLREIFTATSLMLVVGITLLMQLVGVSPALGAFVAGLVLANSQYKHTLETDIEPFKGLLLGLFFISVGMGMNFTLFAQQPVTLMAALAIVIAVKAMILFTLGRWFKIGAMHNIGFAFALSQGGEFAFVLFQFSGALNILSAQQVAFLTLLVALSIVSTPILMFFYSRYITPRFMSLLPDHAYDVIEEKNPIILAGFGRFGQIIGRFIGGQGIKLTVLENNPDQIEMLRKFGFKGYFGDASRLDLLHSAGAAQARILVVAVDDADVCLKIVTLARENFPHLKIFARARNRRHAYELHKAGVDYFKRETFDSSLAMAQEIMVTLGFRESDMNYKASRFLRHDESVLRKSFEFFDSEPDLISFARQSRGELERILQEDSVSNDEKVA